MGRIVNELKEGWNFIQGDCADAYKIDFDDTKWENVNVPHDWAVKGPFDEMNDVQITRIIQDGEKTERRHSGRTGGLPHVGKAWYRLNFELPDIGDKRIRLEFDGVMSRSKVFVNGQYVDSWPYGYASFAFDVTDYVKLGENLLVVGIDNQPHSSRWYPGAGIYRNVRMVTMNSLHVAHWGTNITTPAISDKEALVKIETTLENHGEESFFKLETKILKDGKEVASASEQLKVSDTKTVVQEITVPEPKLWMPGSPELYKAVSSVKVDGETVDSYETVFGIRSLEFDSNTGFKINGKSMRFKGVCMHHDLGPLGSAVNRTALKRQLMMLQEMGCNAIRTSHNPPTPELLELADKMGILIIDEAFDEWQDGKCKNGYSTLFEEWAEKDLRAVIRRDRNHPSVIMWSIGNEINEQKYAEGRKVGQFLHDICKDEDPTRLTTAGFDQSDNAIKYGLAEVIDVPGWNYKPMLYAGYHHEHPDWPMYGSETASCTSSRGFYYFPVEEEEGPVHEHHQLSSYDLVSPSWGTIPDMEFRGLDENPYIMGEFVWTGFDYLGEPTPYGTVWPNRSSMFGIIDLCGIPKDRFFLYQSRWSDKPVLHLLPHWTWPGREGELTPVHCYTNCDVVELFVNGNSYGRRCKTPKKMLEQYRLIWNTVIYEFGEVKAVAYDKDNNIIAEKVIKTAAKPAGIQLSSRPEFSDEETDDMAFVLVEIVDKDGVLCPTADNTVKFNVEGAEIAAVGNGNPATTELFVADFRKAFSGKCMVYLRYPRGIEKGKISITAESEGLESSKLSI